MYSIQWKISGQLYFSGQAQLFKNRKCEKYIQYSEISGQTLLPGQAQVAQKSWTVKKFQYSVYSIGGDPCNLG